MNNPVNSDEFSGNMIRPFQLETSSLRGRIVRFNTVLNDILQPHDYPDAVSQLLGEVVTLCSLLSSMLKFNGIFTLQTSGNGPISMLVADVTSGGDIRGCASFDQERLANLPDKVRGDDGGHTLTELLGKGYIAFTVDQGDKTDRYQGIVELKGSSLVDSVQHYFTQSEQIDTAIRMAVGKRQGEWRSAGLMLQHMPTDGGVNEARPSDQDEDDWRRSMILMESCKDDELLSPELNSHAILLRLFHEEGIRVFAPIPLQHQCRCSKEKVDNIFSMMPEDERIEMVEEGKVTLTCEFCSTGYELDPAALNKVINEKLKDSSSNNASI